MHTIPSGFRRIAIVKAIVLVINLCASVPQNAIAEDLSTEVTTWRSPEQQSAVTAITIMSNETNSTVTAIRYRRSTTTPSSSSDDDLPWQYVNGYMILTYGPPILIAFATFGNAMSVIVLQNPMFRKSPTSFILSALAFVDGLVVDVGLMRLWITYMFDVEIRSFTSAGCKLHIFLTYFLRQLSSWTLILMTAERVVSVWFPFKCKELCSRRRIVAAWCGIVVVFIGVNFHFFFTFDLLKFTEQLSGNETYTYYACTYLRKYKHFWFDQWYWIDAILRDFIPFGVIFAGNVFIVTRIIVANRLRTGQMQAAGTKDEKGQGRKVTSSTATLIVVSVIFLALNIPSDVYFLSLGSGLLKSETDLDISILQLFYSSINIIYYTNNSINFLMYFTSGRKFRLAFVDTVTCRWCRGAPRPGTGKKTGATSRTEGDQRTRGATRTGDMSMTTFSNIQ